MAESKPHPSTFTKASICHKEKIILEFCRNKSVLDVGCIGQDKSLNSQDWLHQRIKSVASELVGADTDTIHLAELKQKGFHISHPQELEGLNKKFDVIVMADVIEHVDDITAFLRFYMVFLKQNGSIVITTPNPFSIRQFFSILLYGKPSCNPEHTSWLDPLTMSELSSRVNLRLNLFCWLHEYSPPMKLRNVFLFPFFKLVYSVRRYYSPNFLFELTR